MDEMKLVLKTLFARKIAGKLIQNKFGKNVDVSVNEVHVTMKDDKISLHADVDLSMSASDFEHMMMAKLS